MSTKNDIKLFDVYRYSLKTKRLIKLSGAEKYNLPFGYTYHHRVKQQVYKRNPEKYKDEQRLIQLPTFVENTANMHAEADSYHSKFKERWGIPIQDVIFNEKEEKNERM